MNEVNDVRELLRAVGLRCTAARMAVLHQLRQATAPLTHAEIAAELVPQGFDKATLYRNLIDLVDAGLANRTELGDHVWRFEFRDPDSGGNGEHPHFVCIDCGTVTCMTDVELGPATKAGSSKIGRVTEILLKGHCKECD